MTITEGANVLTYTYSADYQRIKGVLSGNAGVTLNKRYYFGDFERDITGAVTRDIHYIGVDGLNCIIEKIGTNVSYYYVYKDYLGSILTVTNSTGTIVEEKNFDAWGKNRNPTDWTYNNIAANSLAWLTRGYTGHEHLQPFGLINMNGRLYDPILGRMLSPDNYTQGGSQGYNRYTYAMNNPLKYTDPDGQNPLLIGAGVSILMNGFANMQSGQPFFKGAIQAGIMGAIGAGWSMAIGSVAQSLAMAGVNAIKVGLFQVVAHGVTGGLMSHVQGGNFWSGAASGAVSSVIGSLTGKYGLGVRLLAGGLSGGIASSIAGGNFWDGVKQGLITTGLNHALHSFTARSKGVSVIISGPTLNSDNSSSYTNGLAGHATINIDGTVYSFEGNGEWTTYKYKEYIKHEETLRQLVEIELNVDAIKVQEALNQRTNSTYDVTDNSCVTQCMKILEAGGIPFNQRNGAVSPLDLGVALHESTFQLKTHLHLPKYTGLLGRITYGVLFENFGFTNGLKMNTNKLIH